MVVRSAQNRRVYEQVASHLEWSIQRGEFKPGDRLPSERDLAKQLGVSRPSVREAIIALEMAGLLDVRVGGATYVRAKHLSDINASIGALQALPSGALEQIDASKLLEEELAALAARMQASQTIAVLERALTGDLRLPEDGFLAPITRAAHQAVARGSGNVLLASLAIDLWELRADLKWERYRDGLIQFDQDPVMRAERGILLQSIRGGVERDARASMARTHLRMKELLFDWNR